MLKAIPVKCVHVTEVLLYSEGKKMAKLKNLKLKEIYSLHEIANLV